MKFLITGASGFVGQYVVAQALRKGHQVRAVVRPSSNPNKLPWSNHPALELARIDLRRKAGIVDALQGVDAVIHLAAAKDGDFYTRFAGTVVTTENLLHAMVEANVMRLINISTFCVYDYLRIPSRTTLTEDSAIEPDPSERDGYTQTKLIQEELVQEFQQNHQNSEVTTIRPGLIYGKDNVWSTLLGGQLTENLWLRIGGYATMPLTYIENCADAIICAGERPQAVGQIINIVDDNLPNQNKYVKKLQQYDLTIPKTIPINWTLMRSIAWVFWKYNKTFLQGQARLPGIFNPVILDARFKHFRFSNDRAKQILNWQPEYSLDTALARISSGDELLEVSSPSLTDTKEIVEENLCGLPT